MVGNLESDLVLMLTFLEFNLELLWLKLIKEICFINMKKLLILLKVYAVD